MSARCERLDLRRVERPALEPERRASRHDIERPRLDPDVTDRGDGPGEVADDELPDADHEGRRADGRVSPGAHRGRPCVPRLSLEHDRERCGADDAGDDPDVDARLLEHGTLLDVQLEVAGEGGGVAARGEDAFLAELHASELRDEELTATAWSGESVGGEPSGEREAAERADQRPLLVGEVDGLERDRQLEPRVLHGTKHLERADDAEGAVEPPSAPDGIEVRAEQERARLRIAGREDGGVVGGAVDPRLEACGSGPLVEPGARGEVRGRERLAIDPAVGRRADRGEGVEVGSEAIGVDAKQHGGDASPASPWRHTADTEP